MWWKKLRNQRIFPCSSENLELSKLSEGHFFRREVQILMIPLPWLEDICRWQQMAFHRFWKFGKAVLVATSARSIQEIPKEGAIHTTGLRTNIWGLRFKTRQVAKLFRSFPQKMTEFPW